METKNLPPQFRILGGLPRMRHIAILTNCWILTFLMATSPAHGQPASAAGQSVRLEVTRDTWVSDVGSERDGNNGGASRLKLKSIQEMTLVDVDTGPLRGRTIRSAALHVRRPDNERLRRVTIGSVGAEWFEGTGSGYSVQPGGATFRRRRHPDLTWSSGGGDLCHVILGNGGTTWRMADASPPDREGWQSVRGRPSDRGGPYGWTQLRLPGVRRHGVGMDPPRRDVHATDLPQPVRLQPGTEPLECPLFPGRARAGRSSTAGGPEQPESRIADGPVASRRGDDLVGDAPRLRPGRHARVLRGDRRPALATRVDPDGRRGGRSGRDASSRRRG